MGTNRTPSAALLAPGSTNAPVPLAPDLPVDARRRAFGSALRCASRADVVAAYEAICRAILAGVITAAEHKALLATVRAAAEMYLDRDPRTVRRADRSSHAAREGRERSQVDPDADPEVRDEPELEREPTFEERVREAARERKARESAP